MVAVVGGDGSVHHTARGLLDVAMQVLRVETADKSAVDLASAGPRFIETIKKLWAGALENDGLNRLVLGAGLDWREIAVLRGPRPAPGFAGLGVRRVRLTGGEPLLRHDLPTLVALLAGVGMQGTGWDRMTPRALFHIVSALSRVGLKTEARMIAAEAVARG